ncbi:porin family protein [Flavobacterium sp. MC2016-06]|uniref:porin family protein n=1 Tax=Flavobacterium sp. MC2016-06 TaxID=2676308 RepID=UPI0012BB1CEE|nr:porin family protein [Flavobacterium sp. MC2016-06]MBU3858217.1 PorT family protein [Flavobacterium sp. MC2016-06]
MKKLFLICLTITVTQVSFAQGFFGSITQRLSFGLKAGGNYSNFTNADFDTEGLAGFHAGAIINFKLSENWSVQEEFLFSTQGAKIKDNLLDTTKDLKLSYAAIPIVLKYHSNIGIYGELGFQANMLIEDAKNSGFENFADKIDAGALAGFGYQFRDSPLKGLGIGARYYYGLMDVGKFNSSTVKPDFKNSTAQLSVFYIF